VKFAFILMTSAMIVGNLSDPSSSSSDNEARFSDGELRRETPFGKKMARTVKNWRETGCLFCSNMSQSYDFCIYSYNASVVVG
jgi:hypothetical protein